MLFRGHPRGSSDRRQEFGVVGVKSAQLYVVKLSDRMSKTRRKESRHSWSTSTDFMELLNNWWTAFAIVSNPNEIAKRVLLFYLVSPIELAGLAWNTPVCGRGQAPEPQSHSPTGWRTQDGAQIHKHVHWWRTCEWRFFTRGPTWSRGISTHLPPLHWASIHPVYDHWGEHHLGCFATPSTNGFAGASPWWDGLTWKCSIRCSLGYPGCGTSAGSAVTGQ